MSRFRWASLLAPTVALLIAGSGLAAAQDLGTLETKTLPPLGKPDDPNTPAKELFGRKVQPAQHGGAFDRLLHARLSCRRRVAADQRQDLAGDADLPQPQLGPSEPGEDARASCQQGAVDRLARIADRRHGAAARRTDAHRPLEPSGRARCRHVADADAGARAVAQGARGDDGDQCGRRRLDGRQSEGLVGKIHRALQDGCARTRRSSACWPTRRSRRRCAAT